jgi:hypothetical protein
MASVQQSRDGRWRARYRDESGREHARHFPLKRDAQRWLDEVATAVVTGQYVDPRAGNAMWSSWVVGWMDGQAWSALVRLQRQPSSPSRGRMAPSQREAVRCAGLGRGGARARARPVDGPHAA